MTHLTYTLLLSILVAAATALVGGRGARERAYLGVYVFCCCIAATVAGGWFMYLVHG